MSLKEVIILGCGPTHVDCDFHCETWSVNGGFTMNPPRLDKLFMTDEESEVNASYYDILKLVSVGPTLVLPAPYKKFQGIGLPIEIYPIEKVQRKFPTRFFSNTIAYMLAYALLHTRTIQTLNDLLPKVVGGYHKIYFYGIDMMTNATYQQEKGGVEFWMGIAMGMGVEIVNTRESATGKTWNNKMYGHYGLKEEEQLQEALMAPWELIRASKASNPQDDWILQDGEFKRVPAQVRAGEEVVKK